MRFIESVSADKFSSFAKKHEMAHFMQSIAYGNVSLNRGNNPYYLGVEVDGKLVAATLIIEEKTKLGFKHFLAPRGFLIDYNNEELLNFFTYNVKEFVKNKKGLYFTINPNIELQHIDNKGNKKDDGFDNHHIVDNLKKVGFTHRGFNTGFEHYQPRYTFRIDMSDDFSKIKKRISKSFLKNVKKSYKYDVEVVRGTKRDLKKFYDLQIETGKRDKFVVPPFNNFESLYVEFKKKRNVELFIGKIYPKKVLKKLEKERIEKEKQLDLIGKNKNKMKQVEKSIQRINKDIKVFEEYKDKEQIILSAHLVLYYGKGAWALFAGSKTGLNQLYANNRVYYEKLLYSKERGVKFFDLFGTTGDLSSDNPLIGIHKFKEQLGGKYTEFIGEFYIVNNNLMFWFYKTITFIYRKIRKLIRA